MQNRPKILSPADAQNELPGRRVLALDVLRGVAILLVLMHHAILFQGDLGVLGKIVNPICELGWTGVDLFFVLSGFLIGNILFKEVLKKGEFDARMFLVRRAFKIWPAYAALVAFAMVKAMHHGRLSTILSDFWPNLLHLQNYRLNPYLPHTWSLAVEEHFYLALAIVIACWARSHPARIDSHGDRAIVFVIAVVTLYRVYIGLGFPFSITRHFTATHIRIDSLLAGVLLAHQAVFRRPRWERWLQYRRMLLVAGMVMLLPTIWIPRTAIWMHTLGYTGIYFAYACILISALSFGLGGAQQAIAPALTRALANGLAWVGVSSYGIYLWHADLARAPIEFHVAPRLQTVMPDWLAWSAGMMIYITVAVLAGWLLTQLIERPGLMLRDLWVHRHVPPVSQRSTTRSPQSAELVVPA